MYSTTESLTTNIQELQSDVLLESVAYADNPNFKSSSISSRNKALKTTSQTIVKAINELLASINSLNIFTSHSVNTQYSLIGDVASDSTLLTRLHNIAPTIIEALDELKTRIEALEAAGGTLSTEQQNQLLLANDDYEDVFVVAENETQSEFILTHKPIGKIRLYIDGVRYFKNTFSYDETENKVTWLFTPENNGFEITDQDVVFCYDYDPEAEEATE